MTQWIGRFSRFNLHLQVVNVSFTLNIVERELEPFGRVVRTFDGNPMLREVRQLLKPDAANAQATLYVCDNEADVLAAQQAGCHAVFVSPDAHEPIEGAVLSVLEGETASVVFDALLDIAHRYGEWERKMDFLRLAGGSLQDLVDVSEPFLKNNVVVLDPALKLVAYTKGVPCDDPITVELIEHGYHTESNIRKFKLNRRFKSWANDDGFVVNDTHVICKYTTIVKSFKSHSSFSIITVMMCNVSDDLPYIEDVFGLFTDRIEFYAQRDYPDDKPSGSAVDTFLKDLITDTVDEEAVIERSQYVGLPASGSFCLFYMETEENSVPASRLLAETALIVAPAKTLLVDNAVVVLCFNCTFDKRSTCPSNKTCLRERQGSCEACQHENQANSGRLNKLLERHDLTCGRSSKFTQLSALSTAFAQAREAFKQSRREDVRKRGLASNAWSRIFPFDRFSMEYLAEQLPDGAIELMNSTYVGSIVEAIAEQDKISHTNNYEFLYAYLVHERRTSTVAEELHMHRNNVSYRIGRIEEQFGIDTSDPQVRLDLLLAFRIHEACGQVW